MMHGRFTVRAFAGLALTAGLLAGAACGSSGPSGASAVTSATPHHTAHGTLARTDASDVVMHLIAYQPDEVNVPVGTTVTWTQQDAGFHTVTAGTVKKDPSGSVEEQPDGTFASGKLATSKTFAFSFDKAGTYPYFCEIHPATMSGRVSVA